MNQWSDSIELRFMCVNQIKLTVLCNLNLAVFPFFPWLYKIFPSSTHTCHLIFFHQPYVLLKWPFMNIMINDMMINLVFSRSAAPSHSCCVQGRNSVGYDTPLSQWLSWYSPTFLWSLFPPFEIYLGLLVSVLLLLSYLVNSLQNIWVNK